MFFNFYPNFYFFNVRFGFYFWNKLECGVLYASMHEGHGSVITLLCSSFRCIICQYLRRINWMDELGCRGVYFSCLPPVLQKFKFMRISWLCLPCLSLADCSQGLFIKHWFVSALGSNVGLSFVVVARSVSEKPGEMVG
jgi:hypothetical protein